MLETLGFAMAVQFKPDGKGNWLYRKDQTGAPIPVTKDERDRHVRRYGWITLSSLPLFMALVIGTSMVFANLFPDPTNVQGMFGALPIAGIAFAVTYIYLKWFSHAPARAFADRAPVGPPTTLKQVRGATIARLTYGKLTTRVLGLIVLTGAAGLTADIPDAERPIAMAFALGLPLLIGLAFAVWKWNIERQPG